MAVIFGLRREWWCPKCTTMAVTDKPYEHVEFHHCPGLAGIWAPMFERGEKHGTLLVKERDDYQGKDTVTKDANGRPIMRVEKIVGNDQKSLVVFAGSGNIGVDVGEVEECLPSQVKSKGRAAMRSFASQALLRNLSRFLPKPTK